MYSLLGNINFSTYHTNRLSHSISTLAASIKKVIYILFFILYKMTTLCSQIEMNYSLIINNYTFEIMKNRYG
jgi:hypothetical protein